jgi:hypothetical protein
MNADTFDELYQTRALYALTGASFFVILVCINLLFAERQTNIDNRIKNLENELQSVKENFDELSEKLEDDNEDGNEADEEDNADDTDEDTPPRISVSPVSDIDEEIVALKENITEKISSIQTTLTDHTENITTLVKKLKLFETDPNHYQAWLGDAEGDDWSLSIKIIRKDLSSFNANDIWNSWDGTRDGSTVNRDRCVGVDDIRAWVSSEGEITKRYCADDWTSGIDITIKLYHEGALTPEDATARLTNLVREKKIEWKRTLIPLGEV